MKNMMWLGRLITFNKQPSVSLDYLWSMKCKLLPTYFKNKLFVCICFFITILVEVFYGRLLSTLCRGVTTIIIPHILFVCDHDNIVLFVVVRCGLLSAYQKTQNHGRLLMEVGFFPLNMSLRNDLEMQTRTKRWYGNDSNFVVKRVIALRES